MVEERWDGIDMEVERVFAEFLHDYWAMRSRELNSKKNGVSYVRDDEDEIHPMYPAQVYKEWTRLMQTPYDQLTREEQANYLMAADHMLERMYDQTDYYLADRSDNDE